MNNKIADDINLFLGENNDISGGVFLIIENKLFRSVSHIKKGFEWDIHSDCGDIDININDNNIRIDEICVDGIQIHDNGIIVNGDESVIRIELA